MGTGNHTENIQKEDCDADDRSGSGKVVVVRNSGQSSTSTAETGRHGGKGHGNGKATCGGFHCKEAGPAVIPNDGRQTPMRGHPVFKAQHACACCCRGCLNKWYRVPEGTELTEDQQHRIVDFLMAWIEQELSSV